MQNYKNHLRFNPLHHFVITPLCIGLIVIAVILFNESELSSLQRWFFLITAILMLLIALIARLYGLKNQDRLIRVEMRQRYFELTGKRFTEKEEQLRMGQIIALRFASDDELLNLIDRAINEKLSNKAIKKSISNWKADKMRV